MHFYPKREIGATCERGKPLKGQDKPGTPHNQRRVTEQGERKTTAGVEQTHSQRKRGERDCLSGMSGSDYRWEGKSRDYL
ncbi:hypothetical protein RSOLAG1IB_04479 [Rhizoctonia solani AG-1 IB]|uniref:Uncharacterized protein n=1 Tax=Thanatephorus cucumeris (strain AG1-IB / isolate 7/3/14) TaxID=1108050 RepID=A0A0B7FXX5_THACB|nr:hypothetical protein RSOLAG1IB_04479 [Rhizoctonia solani AG-1 IB]